MAHQRPIDKEFEDADDTGVLVLSGRNLRGFPNVPGELCDLNDVFEADFSKNRLDRIPEEVCTFRSLVKLNCYHNSIRFVPENLVYLSQLKELNLSRNFLQQIPPELCRMNLLSLNLSNNRLVSLPLELGKLKQLRHLDLSCNFLPDLPPSIVLLQSLQHLDLHRNELRELPQDIYKLPLRYLDVSGNCLCRLPSTIRHIESLSTFVTSNNPMESPPTQVCIRGVIHIFKYLESMEKRGSDPHLIGSLNNRDESLRRRKDRSNRRPLSTKMMMDSPGMENGRDHALGLYDEMANLVNTAFGDDSSLFKSDGEMTPLAGATHWSIAQYMSAGKDVHHGGMSDQSKEEYREAAHRLYMEQERQKSKLRKYRSSSPPVGTPPSTAPHTTQSSTHYGTLPKRKGSKDEDGGGEVVRPHFGGPSSRSLPSDKVPRSGSWNSHMRRSSPVLPSKYSMPLEKKGEEKVPSSVPEEEEDHQKAKQAQRDAVRDFVMRRSTQSRSATELRGVGVAPGTSSEAAGRSPGAPKKHKPAPLESTPLAVGKAVATSTPPDSPISSRDGSITPTNEFLSEDNPEEPHTPKDTPKHTPKHEASGAVDSQDEKPGEVVHPVEDLSAGPGGHRLRPSPGDVVIQDLDEEPCRRVAPKELSPISPQSPGSDATWPRLSSPRRKKNKDVFKILGKHDPNYTMRRQQFQMTMIMEKHHVVKTRIESLLCVSLSEDLGDWATDGVVLCQLINKLHPGKVPLIHIPPDGQTLSRAKQTMNIAAFIASCRDLKVPSEELCSAGDITELRDPVRVIACLQRLLEFAGP